MQPEGVAMPESESAMAGPSSDEGTMVAERLDLLLTEIGRPEPVAMAVAAFLSGLDDLVQRAVAPVDAADRHRAAHTLAGSAETLGAGRLGAAARGLMDEVRDQDAAPSDGSCRRLVDTAATARLVLGAEARRRGWELPPT